MGTEVPDGALLGSSAWNDGTTSQGWNQMVDERLYRRYRYCDPFRMMEILVAKFTPIGCRPDLPKNHCLESLTVNLARLRSINQAKPSSPSIHLIDSPDILTWVSMYLLLECPSAC
jgi:hypothetical protein